MPSPCSAALLVALLAPLTALAQAPVPAQLRLGDRLPELQGEYLSGRKALLPRDSAGHAALLLFGFTYASRFAVEPWANRFRQEYGGNPQVTFYEIPMIGGMARMGKWFIDSGMRRGTATSDYEHVITVYGGTAAWKLRLGVAAEDAAYLVVLDPQGNIAWRDSGPCTPARFDLLAAHFTPLLPAPRPGAGRSGAP